MLVFILTVLFMLALLDKTFRLDRQKMRALETEFKLSAIRESLLISIAKGEQPDNSACEFFEELTTNTKTCLDWPLLWELAVLFAFTRQKPVKDAQVAQFTMLITHRDNRHVSESYGEYQKVLRDYLEHRHRLLIGTLRFLHLAEKNDTRVVQQSLPSELNRSANFPSYLPFLRTA